VVVRWSEAIERNEAYESFSAACYSFAASSTACKIFV
jgi:hypothetical protein